MKIAFWSSLPFSRSQMRPDATTIKREDMLLSELSIGERASFIRDDSHLHNICYKSILFNGYTVTSQSVLGVGEVVVCIKAFLMWMCCTKERYFFPVHAKQGARFKAATSLSYLTLFITVQNNYNQNLYHRD